MNLQQFIKETLVQIAHGINEADEAVAGIGAAVNPRDVVFDGKDDRPYGYYAEDKKGQFRRAVQSINFDVVVTVAEGTETKGGIGIHVGAIGLGSAGKSEKGQTSESRIKFSVPLLIPNSKNA
ncbi:hypothetical protein [Prosthecobacter sp.]|jgi:hypothetical protein|uniref:hypothetical protein n=1 Tax=Prosthecobacter sp. TaxID=1965333 RepID=UPI0037C8ECDF